MSDDVAEGLVDEAAHLTGQVVLRADPVEEFVEEGLEDALPLQVSRRGRQATPRFIELVERRRGPLPAEGTACRNVGELVLATPEDRSRGAFCCQSHRWRGRCLSLRGEEEGLTAPGLCELLLSCSCVVCVQAFSPGSGTG